MIGLDCVLALERNHHIVFQSVCNTSHSYIHLINSHRILKLGKDLMQIFCIISKPDDNVFSKQFI